MKTTLLAATLFSLAALLPLPRADAGIDLDFRAELQWRADYHDDLEAAVVLYEYSHYRGRRLVIYPDEQLEDLYDYEWGFRVRSVQVIGPVHIVLFDESGLWGHQLEVYHDIADLGSYRMRLNDYSTFRWHRRARSGFVSFNPVGLNIRINLGRHILPRIYCARPIAPHYYRPAPSYHYYNPRPRHDYPGYRQNTHTRPQVTPPPPNRIPGSVHRSDLPPTRRPGYTPGRPPSAKPDGRPHSSTRPSVEPNRQNAVPPTNRPPQARPGGQPTGQNAVPPTNRPPQARPSGQPTGQAPSQKPTQARPKPPPERAAPPSAPPSAVPSRSATPPPSVSQRTTSRPTPAARPSTPRSSRPPATAPKRQASRSAPPPPPRRN